MIGAPGRIGLVGAAGRVIAVAPAALVLPSAIASCVHWWSPAAGVTGSSVSSWVDAVAALDAVHATGASQPAFSATAFGADDPGIVFDGVDDFLGFTGTGSLPVGDSPHVILIRFIDAAAADDGDVTRALIGWGSTTNTRSLQRNSAGGVDALRAALAATNVNVTTAETLGQHWGMARYDGDQGFISQDGGAEAASAAGLTLATTTTGGRIGAAPVGASTTGWSGTIGDIGVFAAASLAGADLTNMQAFFGR